jgi:hypothetical protein
MARCCVHRKHASQNAASENCWGVHAGESPKTLHVAGDVSHQYHKCRQLTHWERSPLTCPMMLSLLDHT